MTILGVRPKIQKNRSLFFFFCLSHRLPLMYINKNCVDSFQSQSPISRLVPTKLQQLAQFDSLTEPEDDSSIMKYLPIDKLVWLSWRLSSLVPARFLLVLDLMFTPMGKGTCKIRKVRLVPFLFYPGHKTHYIKLEPSTQAISS